MNNKSIKYDILLKGGRVIDPANNIDDLFDVGISGGFIANGKKASLAITDPSRLKLKFFDFSIACFSASTLEV